jgi:hypothetical protein
MSNKYLGSLAANWSKGKNVKFSKSITQAFVAELAEKAQPYGFRVYVTSAYRSPADQARVVCNNVQSTNGANLSVYGKRTRGVYRQYCPNNMQAIVDYEAKKLADNIARDPNYQGHGTGFAVDLSVSGMDYNTKVRYKQLIESLGAEVLWEKSPEHFHVWLKDWKPKVDYGWTRVLAYGGLLSSLGLATILGLKVAKRKGLFANYQPTHPLSRLGEIVDRVPLGSKFDMRTSEQIQGEKEPKEFVPFYILFSQNHYVLSEGGSRNKRIIFGPFEKKDAMNAFHSLAVFFRSFGNGDIFTAREYNGQINQHMKDQYNEFFDKSKMWNGPKDRNPYFNLAPSRTTRVKRGPDQGKTYTREWMTILDSRELDGRPSFNLEMTDFSFEMWTWSPDYRKEGNVFYPNYGDEEEKRTPIPIYAPIFLQMWQTYLLPSLAQIYTFPQYQGSSNKVKDRI